MSSLSPRHLLLLVAITLVWGLNFVVAKAGVDQMPPILFSALRFLLLALCLLPFLRWHGDSMGAVIVAAVLLGALHFGLMFVGLALSGSVSAVAIVGQLGVPFATLLSIALLGEKVRWRRWLGITLSFAGVCIMGFDPIVFGHAAGAAFMAAAAFVGALGLIAVKKLPPIEPLQFQAWVAVLGGPLLFATSLIVEGDPRPQIAAASAAEWGAVLYTALASSLFAHTAYFMLLRRYPVTSVAPLTVLSPLFAVVFGVLLLGEQLPARVAVGGAITLLGVIIITMREKQLIDTGS